MPTHPYWYLKSSTILIRVTNSAPDLKLDNIMIKVEDPIILERSARDEYDNPLPQKVTHERTIYLARNNYGKLVTPTGAVQITDFDLAVSGRENHNGPIQVESYRAPEVILDVGYSYSADIWNFGVMVRPVYTRPLIIC